MCLIGDVHMKKPILLYAIFFLTIILCSCRDTSTFDNESNSLMQINQTTLSTDMSSSLSVEEFCSTTDCSMVDETIDTPPDIPTLDINYYENNGRIAMYPIVLGAHIHDDCMDDERLLELGNQKLNDAIKLYKVLNNTVPRNEKTYKHQYHEDRGMSEEFGTYNSILALCDNTFASNAVDWGYAYAIDCPNEFFWMNEANRGSTIYQALKDKMHLENGDVYLCSGYLDGHTISTTIEGVISATDTKIVYRLCTKHLDESPLAEIAIDENGNYVWQYFYTHSIMRLEYINDEWLITELRYPLGGE